MIHLAFIFHNYFVTRFSFLIIHISHFQILGILVIVFGCLGWGAMPQQYAIGIIVLGGIILLISMFGCFGAIRESSRMLWTVSAQ